jgi:hypothetical protein
MQCNSPVGDKARWLGQTRAASPRTLLCQPISVAYSANRKREFHAILNPESASAAESTLIEGNVHDRIDNPGIPPMLSRARGAISAARLRFQRNRSG